MNKENIQFIGEITIIVFALFFTFYVYKRYKGHTSDLWYARGKKVTEVIGIVAVVLMTSLGIYGCFWLDLRPGEYLVPVSIASIILIQLQMIWSKNDKAKKEKNATEISNLTK